MTTIRITGQERMRTRTIHLTNEAKRKLAITLLGNLPVDGSVDMIAKPHKDDRSAAQNRFYWGVALKRIAEETGAVEDNLHDDFRLRILSKIFIAEHEGYAEEVNEIMQDIRGERQDKHILRITSTTDAAVTEFSDYLKRIENEVNGIDIYFPADELKLQAMGKGG